MHSRIQMSKWSNCKQSTFLSREGAENKWEDRVVTIASPQLPKDAHPITGQKFNYPVSRIPSDQRLEPVGYTSSYALTWWSYSNKLLHPSWDYTQQRLVCMLNNGRTCAGSIEHLCIYLHRASRNTVNQFVEDTRETLLSYVLLLRRLLCWEMKVGVQWKRHLFLKEVV